MKKTKQKILLVDSCSFIRGVTFSKDDEVDNEIGIGILRSHNVDFDNHRVTFDNLKYVFNDVKVKEEQRLTKNDILISVANSKELTGKCGFSYSDTKYYAGGFMAILRPNKNIVPYYLFLNLLTENFKQFIQGKNQGTTSIWNITFNRIQDFEFYFPRINEQQRISDLFQTIDQSINIIEGQEKKLILIQKSLSNGLANKQPLFGNLLSKKYLKPCSFSDIVDCIEEHCRTPLADGLTRFVGLEDITSDNLTLQGFGNIEDGTTFTKQFVKGDVLFGKRRAYLRKVAIADFDGICSSDILVFRAFENKVIPELLPYYVFSDAFMQHAINTSAGSLSPRTKWRDLAGFQLSIPPIETQAKIVDVFKQLSKSLQLLCQQKESLKKLNQKLLNEILG